MGRPSEISAATEAAVRATVGSLERAFNAHDAIALSEHFAEEASWSTVAGQRLDGREAIADFAARKMPELADQFARYEVARLLPIRPDVFAVNVVQTPTTKSGGAVDGAKAVALYVIAEEDGEWKIAAGQNSFLARHDAHPQVRTSG